MQQIQQCIHTLEANRKQHQQQIQHEHENQHQHQHEYEHEYEYEYEYETKSEHGLNERSCSNSFHTLTTINNNTYVIKTSNATQLQNEYNVIKYIHQQQKQMKHMEIKHIIDFIYFIHFPNENHYLICPYIHGSMLNCTKQIYFHDFIQLIHQLHTINILHNDLKPQHLLIQYHTNKCYIVDFDTASKYQQHTSHNQQHINTAPMFTYIGTPEYSGINQLLCLPSSYSNDYLSLIEIYETMHSKYIDDDILTIYDYFPIRFYQCIQSTLLYKLAIEIHENECLKYMEQFINEKDQFKLFQWNLLTACCADQELLNIDSNQSEIHGFLFFTFYTFPIHFHMCEHNIIMIKNIKWKHFQHSMNVLKYINNQTKYMLSFESVLCFDSFSISNQCYIVQWNGDSHTLLSSLLPMEQLLKLYIQQSKQHILTLTFLPIYLIVMFVPNQSSSSSSSSSSIMTDTPNMNSIPISSSTSTCRSTDSCLHFHGTSTCHCNFCCSCVNVLLSFFHPLSNASTPCLLLPHIRILLCMERIITCCAKQQHTNI
jgi:serine/threonine protein kinase